MQTKAWMVIEVKLEDDDPWVSAQSSDGGRAAWRPLGAGWTHRRLDAFARSVGRAVAQRARLDKNTLREAQALHSALFSGQLRDLAVRVVTAAAKNERVLLRFMLHDRPAGVAADGAPPSDLLPLQAIPWEALCEPNTAAGFLANAPKIWVARGVISIEECEPREVLGRVRVLAIAPPGGEASLRSLRAALEDAIKSGQIEWLEPISGDKAGLHYLFPQLRASEAPHVIHFIGHGGFDLDGNPTLQLEDPALHPDDEGEPIIVEQLARELASCFRDDLHLVVLEACSGADPGTFGSAADMFLKSGIDAVVAHLWPVDARVARDFSQIFYKTLTGTAELAGDVAASVAVARSAALLNGAEGLSPVLSLRSAATRPFNFENRNVVEGDITPRGALGSALSTLVDRPFSLILGDKGDDHTKLRAGLEKFLADNKDPVRGLPLPSLMQRCELRFGQGMLNTLFQQALLSTLNDPIPPLITALARLLPPGIHTTSLWLPLLERALSAQQPDRTLYVIQPALLSSSGEPRVVKRAAGTRDWDFEPGLPKTFNFATDLFVLRLYGGYPPDLPILVNPVLTEDDHIHGLIGVEGLRPPLWVSPLLGHLRNQRGLFVGLSVLEWRHRMLLRWLYDKLPAPDGSVAILDAAAYGSEQEIWGKGGGLPGGQRIAPVGEDPVLLGALGAVPRLGVAA